MRPTKMIVSLSSIEHNARQVRSRVPASVKLMCVVKANSYGHGAAQVSRRLVEKGLADYLAVANAEEAEDLRQNGIETPVLILGGGDREEMELSVSLSASHAVYDREMLENLSQAAARLGCAASAHLKLDTGMTRIGVPCHGDLKKLESLLDAWRDYPNVRLDGAFTHFSAADTDPEYTRFQNERFKSALSLIRSCGYAPIAHAAASEALENREFQHDMVRPGIVLYGSGAKHLNLRHAQTLLTRPVRVESIPAGTSVGSGRTFTARRDSLIATLPIGYGDGYPRALGGKADCLVNGRRAKIVGRVCMDMLTVDVTGIPGVTRDTDFVLLGRQGEEAITPDELAALSGTIPYEIMLGFLPRVRREYAEPAEE